MLERGMTERVGGVSPVPPCRVWIAAIGCFLATACGGGGGVGRFGRCRAGQHPWRSAGPRRHTGKCFDIPFVQSAGLVRIERDHQLFGILHGWRSNRIGDRIVQPSGCPGAVKRGGLLMLGVGL